MEIISSFNKNDHTLNVYGSFQEPLFLAQDVGKMLGMKNIRASIANMNSKWKLVKNLDRLGNGQKMTLLTEPGLNWIIMRSNKKEAVKFQEWVCETVLPSIRKTGSYQISNYPVKQQLTFNIQNEFDLHSKVVNFIKNRYPEALFVATLGELQDTSDKRIKSNRMGYQRGSPDLIVQNLHKYYSGFAIEFKTPKGTGIVSEAQDDILKRYKLNNYKTLCTNDYDECITQLVEYFQNVRIGCEHCSLKFKNQDTLAKHHKYFHRIRYDEVEDSDSDEDIDEDETDSDEDIDEDETDSDETDDESYETKSTYTSDMSNTDDEISVDDSLISIGSLLDDSDSN